MITWLVVAGILAWTTFLVAWLVLADARRMERRDARFRSLHPSCRHDSVDATPADEHVRLIGPGPYDWAQQREDTSGS